MSNSDQVRAGALLGVKWLIVIAWICAVAMGLGMALSNPLPRRLVGVGFLALAGLVAVSTVKHWIRLLPGVLGLEVLNALIAVWQGHPAANPSETMPRQVGLLILAILLGCAALTTTFLSRRLTVFDRIALLFFLASQVLAIAWFPSLLGFVFMLLPLLVAWGTDHLLRGGRPNRPRTAG